MRDIFLFYNIRSEIYSRTQSEFLCGTLFALKGMEQIKENQMNSYHYIKTFSKKFLLALLPVILLFAPTREIRFSFNSSISFMSEIFSMFMCSIYHNHAVFHSFFSKKSWNISTVCGPAECLIPPPARTILFPRYS